MRHHAQRLRGRSPAYLRSSSRLLIVAVLRGRVRYRCRPAHHRHARMPTTPASTCSTVKNVTVDQCQAACLGDDACHAFTFNTKAGWCFLKSDFGDALGGRRRDRRPRGRGGRPDAVARAPAAWRTHLRAGRPARRGARADRRPPQPLQPRPARATRALRNAGRRPPSAPAATTKPRATFGQALAIADDDVDAWLDYTVASLRRNPYDYSDRHAGVAGRHRRRDQQLPARRIRRRPRRGAGRISARRSATAKSGCLRSAPTARASRSRT